jgi:DNA-directed RNA polymerase specialized sigma24 family protein
MLIYKTDNDLIDLIANRDIRALELLIERYKDYVYNMAVKITANREMAEEVMQDSFLKVYQYTTALAAVEKQSKFATATGLPEDSHLPGPEELPVSAYDTHYLKKEIDRAIKQLPPEFGLVLTLYHLNEQSIDEISEILGEKRDTVKVRLFRARKKLKELLVHLKL